MRIAGIGIGQAGDRVLDALAYHSRWSQFRDFMPCVLAINSAQADLRSLKTISPKEQLLIGVTKARGHGVGLQREFGAELAEGSMSSIMRAVADTVLQFVDAFLIIVGLGGGTGSGAAPIVARRLKALYDQPVFVLGILPTQQEGDLMTKNAYSCLTDLRPIVDGIFVFDNDLWAEAEGSMENSYTLMNYELVRPLPPLFCAGEASPQQVGIKVIDASDIIATCEELVFWGHWALSTATVKDRRFWFKRTNAVEHLIPELICPTVIKNAAAKLSAEYDPQSVTKALMVVAGPPKYINMDGFSDAKAWLQRYVPNAEVRGGDYPLRNANQVLGTILLGGVREIPRLGLKFEGEKK